MVSNALDGYPDGSGRLSSRTWSNSPFISDVLLYRNFQKTFFEQQSRYLGNKYELSKISEKRRKVGKKKTPHILGEFNNYREIFSLSGVLEISR